MGTAVNTAASAVKSELLMVTPYFVPADEDLRTLQALRQRQVHVRILTNSLESTQGPLAHSGYMHYRVSLLQAGMDLYEVRSLLGNALGSGQTAKLSRYGNYGLHAKLYVFDRQSLFIGSMNFDQRSKRLNTEIGLIIENTELARQTAARFEGMTRLDNVYALALRLHRPGGPPRLVWDTREEGKPVEYTREPARSVWQRWVVRLLSLLPLAKEL